VITRACIIFLLRQFGCASLTGKVTTSRWYSPQAHPRDTRNRVSLGPKWAAVGRLRL
jgi:hypothetical protein